MGNKTPEPLANGLPKEILRQLSEHTIGGFALFYFHPETGFPQHMLSFDSPAHCLAMQKYMKDWCDALHAIYIEGTKQNIRESFIEPPDEE